MQEKLPVYLFAKATITEYHRLGDFTYFLKVWMPEVQDQSVGRLGFFSASPPLAITSFRLFTHMVPLLLGCLCSNLPYLDGYQSYWTEGSF